MQRVAILGSLAESPAAGCWRRSVRGGDAAAHAAGSGPVMDGDELRRLVVAKWGKPFDTRIHRRRDARQELKFYLQVMWKHVEQQSFHMSEGEYSDQLQAVAELITEWGMAFLRHLNVADASCLSDNGSKWPHDPRAPGCLVKSRAGVGAGGLSPSSSFAGSFIFFVASAACPLRWRRVRAPPSGLFGFSSVARPLSRGLDFFDLRWPEAVQR